MKLVEKKEALEKIAKEVAKCQACSLYKAATKPVPGAGNPQAEVVFIGEAPGYHEDQRGIPFCGRAGKLLDKLMVRADLKREEVFICNILRHRPPNNRDPKPEEVAACQPFLDRQLAVIEPRVIVTLGRFAMNKFLSEAKISQMHGQPRFVDYQSREYVIFPMYHPAASLRNGNIKEAEEKDFDKLGQFLEKLAQVDQPGQLEEVAKSDKQMKLL